MQGWRHRLFKCNNSTFAKVLFNGCLVFALFGGGAWQVLDIPDKPWNQVLDALMVTSTVLFLVEVVLCCVTDRTYPLSFFFFMDVLGSVSMVFEISFLLGPAGKPNMNDTSVDAAIVRVARIAKMAARAGRFVKLARFMELMVFGKRRRRDPEDSAPRDTASVLSSKLTLSVSTKVSLLTITLVIIIPAFALGEYPEEDLSMKAWGQQLEASYRQAYQALAEQPSASTTSIFAAAVSDMQQFYSSVEYFPYRLRGYGEEVTLLDHQATIPGASDLEESEPRRKQNIVELAVSECLVLREGCDDDRKAALLFNFTRPKRVEAGLEMGMCVFVIFVMSAVSSNISSTINKLVVAPLGRIVAKVRDMAAIVFHLTSPGDESEDDLEPDEYYFRYQDETVLLEKVFTKLACIAKIELEENRIVQERIDIMSSEEQGVFVDMMNFSAVRQGSGKYNDPPRRACTNLSNAVGGDEVFDVDLDTWDVNFLTMSDGLLEPSAVCIFFDSELALLMEKPLVEIGAFHNFYKAAMQGYRDVPYHNGKHALDVLHTVYRLLSISMAWHWAGDVNSFALLVAALGHDLGHEGRTNPFLIESRHELAMLYNDASPLENMHCANLFGLSKEEGSNIFGCLSVAQYKEARRTCIAAILHTDNAHHFEMVKDAQQLFEVNSELCDAQARTLVTGRVHGVYMDEILRKESFFFMKLFLHLADVSNPAKPFEACAMWADRALAEFFAQGDEEKRLGFPVGMLNDRDKVNRPSSQHGFINFLVSPLLFGAVSLIPQFHPLMTELANNLRSWRDIWVEEAKPDAEALAKRDEDVHRAWQKAEELRMRAHAPPASGLLRTSVASSIRESVRESVVSGESLQPES